ncbi:MAG: diguanylate cyclase [Lachnospiraceae bacterium]|nr:diguanylate cyclase [Lachnospiraceae bacterium]
MKEGHGRTILKWLIPLICAIIVIAIMLLKFSVDIRKDAVNAVEREIEEVAEKYALRITNELQSILVSGKTAAQVISQQPSKKTDIVQQLLEALVNQTQVYEAVYCNEKGVFVNQDGESVNFGEDIYEEATMPLSEAEYIYLPDDGVLGIPAILIAVPVPDEKGNLLLFYPIKRIKDLINIDKEFGQTAFAVMVDKDGNIFSDEETGSSFLKSGNIWADIDRKSQNAGTQAKVAMQNSSTSSVELVVDGEEKTLAFTPIGIKDWNLVIGIDQSYVNINQNRMWRQFLLMTLQILSVVIVFFLFFVVVNAIGKKRNAENSKTLQEKADTDLLTGLNNKLATERLIKEYIRDYPDSLAMMFVLDIDNFKKINDTQGHTFGDEVLRTLGKRIGVNFRVTDIIGRTGGDEFTIFLKDLKTDSNTLKESRKLVHFFKDFQVGEYVKYSATASIGAAVFPTDGSDFESLYKAADQALYKAKKRGKNQLAFYDDRDRRE